MANVSEAFAKALSPLYSEAFIAGMTAAQSGWAQLFDVKTSKKAKEDIFQYTSLGQAKKIGNLEPVYFDSPYELGGTSWIHETWALGSVFAKELIDDSLHIQFMREVPKWVGRSLLLRAEIEATAVLNHAFDASYPLFDGQPLCGDHVIKSGETVSNYAATPAAMDVTTLWTAYNWFAVNSVDQRGKPSLIKPVYLAYHVSQEQQVRKLLTSDLEPLTNWNDVNTVKNLLKPVPLRFLSENAWFVLGAPQDSKLRFYWRQKPSYSSFPDYIHRGYGFIGEERFSVKAGDWTGAYGNAGA